jgi:rare lipoprotein A (peptidoglycan hydrolase)
MKKWIVLSLLLVPLLASAASFWDGMAALQRGDASFESGLYAASNSFPAGTMVNIQNQDTGAMVTATITGRIEGQSDILLLVSPKTAEALGLGQGSLGRVRVTVENLTAAASPGLPGEQTFSSDPDVNPAAAYAAARGGPSEETLPTAARAKTAPADAALANATPASPEAPPEAAATPPATTAASATPEPSSTTDADSAAIISAAEARVPQKQVFQPPREDQKFAYQKPAGAPPQTAAQPETATITSVDGEPGVRPAVPPASDLALADVAAPEESRPEEVVGASAAPPAAVPPQVALASPDLAPERPPESAARPPAAATNTPATTKPAAAVKTGSPGNFFLQLAAYGTEKNARDLAAKLAPTYPAIVLAPSSPKSSVFKVVIGPLNRAESGTLLTWFRYRGFPDAFVKQE